MLKMKLYYCDWSSKVRSMKKETEQWRDQSYGCSLPQKWYWTIVIDRTKCCLWWKQDRRTTWPILQVQFVLKIKLDCCDWSGRMGLWWKLDRTLTWLIIQVWLTSKTKQNYQDLSNQVWSVIKTRQDNDLPNHTGIVYGKNETKLLWSIGLCAVCQENQARQCRE